jgi:hypothetical protein
MVEIQVGFRSPTSFVNLKGIFDGVEEVEDLGYKWDLCEW